MLTRVMKMNRIKKGFTTIAPEHGLSSLPGAVKTERDPNSESTVRVKGTYIPRNTDRTGKFFGIMCLLLACTYVIALPCTIFNIAGLSIPPLAIFAIGMFVIHGCSMLANSLRHVSEAPWARKGIKIFWISTLVWSLIGMIYFGP